MRVFSALLRRFSVASSASPHRPRPIASATVLSGGAQWVTLDAATSNDLFYFEHNPLRLDAGVGAAAEPLAAGARSATIAFAHACPRGAPARRRGAYADRIVTSAASRATRRGCGASA